VSDLCSFTVAEARAILIADEALGFSYEARLASGQTFGNEEREAWAKLVESAAARIVAYERPVVVPTPCPPCPEEKRRMSWRLSTVSTTRLLHAFRVTSEGGTWSLCGLVQIVNTADFDPALFQDRCKSCARFVRKWETARGE
jgi:hypothetical protein